MNRWVVRLLDPALDAGPVIVALDADGWIDPAEVPSAETAFAEDWWSLRRIWERDGRRRSVDRPPLLIVVSDPELQRPEQLPWDVSHAAQCVRIRPPVDPDLLPLVSEIPENRIDAVIDGLEKRPSDSVGLIFADGWQLSLPIGAPEATEISGVAMFLEDPTTGPATWRAIRDRVRHPIAVALASDPPNFAPLQTAWTDWCNNGDAAASAATMTAVGPRVMPLVAKGLLTTAMSRHDLPAWVRNVTVSTDLGEEAREILDNAPSSADTREGWLGLASLWGRVRALLAQAPPDAETQAVAEEWWLASDAAFCSWLQSGGLASAMTAASPSWPSTVAKVAPFLSRRLRDGEAQRVLLVVVDGMGWPQWDVIKDSSQLNVVQEGGCFAIVPTLTRVSRQAIFAGALPYKYSDSLSGTSKEKQKWQGFWSQELGQSVAPAWYTKLVGSFPRDVPTLPDSKVVVAAVVVNAVDELMHGAVMGDRQLAVDSRTWAQHGFLDTLVGNACTEGFEVWITADHGNVEANALGSPKFEGLAVEQAGSRVRWYGTRDLAESSGATGIRWPNPPGMPADECFAVFAPGRGGYFGSGAKMAHGGLSLDEVIVPLARVER